MVHYLTIIYILYIYIQFNDSFEVKGVFLDVSKALDNLSYDGLIYKLKQNGVSRKLLNVMKDFLDFRKQKVIVNRQYSSWARINADVPQVSIHRTIILFYLHLRPIS